MSDVVTKPEAKQTFILSYRNYRYIWLGQVISSFGDKFSEVAIPILIYDLTSSAFLLAITFIMQTIASLTFGLLAGGLSDRWNQKYTMIGSDTLRGIIVFASFIIIQTSLPTNTIVILMFIFSFLASAAKQFFLPARVSLIPKTVPPEKLLEANSLDQSSSTAAAFLGAAVAGFVVAFRDVETALIVDTTTFLFSSFCIWLIRIEASTEEKSQQSIWESIREGITYCWTNPTLRGTLALSISVPLAIGGFQPLLLIFSREAFALQLLGFEGLDLENFVYGSFESMFPLGIAIGAYAVGKLPSNVSRKRMLIYGVIGMGLGLFLMGASSIIVPQTTSTWVVISLLICLFWLFTSASSNALLFVGLRTIIQEEAPNNMIGRVFSVITVVSSVATALGGTTAGLADFISYIILILTFSGFLVLLGLSALRWKVFLEP